MKRAIAWTIVGAFTSAFVAILVYGAITNPSVRLVLGAGAGALVLAWAILTLTDPEGLLRR